MSDSEEDPTFELTDLSGMSATDQSTPQTGGLSQKEKGSHLQEDGGEPDDDDDEMKSLDHGLEDSMERSNQSPGQQEVPSRSQSPPAKATTTDGKPPTHGKQTIMNVAVKTQPHHHNNNPRQSPQARSGSAVTMETDLESEGDRIPELYSPMDMSFGAGSRSAGASPQGVLKSPQVKDQLGNNSSYSNRRVSGSGGGGKRVSASHSLSASQQMTNVEAQSDNNHGSETREEKEGTEKGQSEKDQISNEQEAATKEFLNLRIAVKLQCFVRRCQAKKKRQEMKKAKQAAFENECRSELQQASATAIQERFRAFKKSKEANQRQEEEPGESKDPSGQSVVSGVDKSDPMASTLLGQCEECGGPVRRSDDHLVSTVEGEDKEDGTDAGQTTTLYLHDGGCEKARLEEEARKEAVIQMRIAVRLQCFVRKCQAKKKRAAMKLEKKAAFEAECNSELQVASATAIQERFRAFQREKASREADEDKVQQRQQEEEEELEQQQKQLADEANAALQKERAAKAEKVFIRKAAVLEDKESEGRLKIDTTGEDNLLSLHMERDRIDRLFKEQRRQARKNKKSETKKARGQEQTPAPPEDRSRVGLVVAGGSSSLNNGLVGDLFLHYDSTRRSIIKEERAHFRTLKQQYEFGHQVGSHSVALLELEKVKRELNEELWITGLAVIQLGFNKKSHEDDGKWTGHSSKKGEESSLLILPPAVPTTTSTSDGSSPSPTPPTSTRYPTAPLSQNKQASPRQLPSLTKALNVSRGDAAAALSKFERGMADTSSAERGASSSSDNPSPSKTISAVVPYMTPFPSSSVPALPQQQPQQRKKLFLFKESAYDGAPLAKLPYQSRALSEQPESSASGGDQLESEDSPRAVTTSQPSPMPSIVAGGGFVPTTPSPLEAQYRLRKYPVSGRGGTVKHLSSLLDRFDSEVVNPTPAELRRGVLSTMQTARK